MGDKFIDMVEAKDFMKLVKLGLAEGGVQLVAGCTVVVVTAAAKLAGGAIKNAVSKLQAKQPEEPEADQA